MKSDLSVNGHSEAVINCFPSGKNFIQREHCTKTWFSMGM